MLKKVWINNKKIPVPVPVKTLGEALIWVDETLVPAGHTITRVILDGRVLDDDSGSDGIGGAPLGESSKLEVQIDSPIDLAVQTLDAMRSLTSVIESGIKPLAVRCWQAKPIDKPVELESLINDVELILDLLEHLNGLIDPTTVEVAAVQGIATMMNRSIVSIKMAAANSDWRACARLLLNRLEPLLGDLISETETLQNRVVAYSPDPKRRAPTG